MNLFQITCKHSYSSINKIQSPIYLQVIKFWFEFYSVNPGWKYCDQETIWNYCRIMINEPINCNSVYRKWIARGISRLRQIRNAEGMMLSKGALEQKYGFQIEIIHAVQQMSYKISISLETLSLTFEN